MIGFKTRNFGFYVGRDNTRSGEPFGFWIGLKYREPDDSICIPKFQPRFKVMMGCSIYAWRVFLWRRNYAVQ